MRLQSSITRVARAAMLVLSLTALAACNDDTEGEEDEPEIARVELRVGSTTSFINEAGTLSTAITLTRGANTVTARVLDASGTVIAEGSNPDYRIDVEAQGAITVNRTGPYTFTLTNTNTTANATTALLRVSVYHVEEGHTDFGPFTVQVALQ